MYRVVTSSQHYRIYARDASKQTHNKKTSSIRNSKVVKVGLVNDNNIM